MIQTQKHGEVLEIRLSRPPVNAINTQLLAALNEAITAAIASGDHRALIISGQPGIFSAGLDVIELINEKQSSIRQFWSEFFRSIEILMRSKLPVVAALTGHSPAGGAILAAHCDFRVGARGDYRMGFNEVQVGLPVPPSILTAIARLTGDAQAGVLALTGRMVTMEDAADIGLVDVLAEPDQVLGESLNWAREVSTGSASAVEATRRNIWQGQIDQLEIEREADRATRQWFEPETRQRIRKLVDGLAAG